MVDARRGRMKRFDTSVAVLVIALVSLIAFFSLRSSQPTGSITSMKREEESPRCVKDEIDKAEDKCAFVRANCESDSLIDYLGAYFCLIGENLKALSISLMVVLVALYFYLLGQTADRFFIPTLERLATGLRLSPGVAGVTLLALGNAAPDLFSTFSAIQQGYYAQAFGQTIGAAMFITHVVVGIVATIAPSRTNRRPFLRNIGFLTIGICTLFIVASDHYIHYYEAIVLLVYYVAFVLSVFVFRLIYQRGKAKKQIKRLVEERDRLLSQGLNLPITHPIFSLDMSIFEDPDMDIVLLPYVKQVVEAVENNDFEKLDDMRELESEEDRHRKQEILRKVLHQLDITYISKIGFWREGSAGHHFRAHHHLLGAKGEDSQPEETQLLDQVDGGILDPRVDNGDLDDEEDDEAPPKGCLPWFLWYIDWDELSLFQKILSVILSPILFAQFLTIHWAEDGKYWRFLYVLHPISMICIFLFFQEWVTTTIKFAGITFGLAIYWGLGVGLLGSVVVFFTTTNSKPPIYDPLFLGLGFFMSCIWINTIADELVTLLNVMGEVFGIPKALLGLTVLAWGNSVGDLVSNSLMARKGFSETALGASFTAPLVHLLVGLGVGFLYKALKDGTVFLDVMAPVNPDLNNTIFLSFIFILFGLVVSLIWVPANGFQFSRPHAVALLLIYVAFMIVGALDVTDVILANVRLWLW